ncbi:MAG: VOC family protein [Longimicrobiales bacterium]
MSLRSVFAVLVTSDLNGSRRFYEGLIGMQAGFVSDWYVHLLLPANPAVQLGLVVAGHESVPAGAQQPNHAVILGIEVADVSVLYETLRAHDAAILGPPRDEPWGQRHFLAYDPQGFLIDLVQTIPPTAEYASAYV